MIFPGDNEALDMLETGEDPKLQELVVSFCSEMGRILPTERDVPSPGTVAL